MSDTDTQEAVARLEGALAFDLDPDTSEPLTPKRKEEIEALLSLLRGDPESNDEADALRSLLGTPQEVNIEPDEAHAAADALRSLVSDDVQQTEGGAASLGLPVGDDAVQRAAAGPMDNANAGEGLDAQLAAIKKQLADLAGGVQQVTQPQQTITLADVLATLDPRDSDAALALFGWLWDNGRFGVIGNLNGGGYMLHYQEPKGTTQAGYIAGGTQGGRMVDAAVDKAKEAGAKPVKRGICEKCFSGVREQEDGTVVLDDDENLNATCSAGGAHILHA